MESSTRAELEIGAVLAVLTIGAWLAAAPIRFTGDLEPTSAAVVDPDRLGLFCLAAVLLGVVGGALKAPRGGVVGIAVPTIGLYAWSAANLQLTGAALWPVAGLLWAGFVLTLVIVPVSVAHRVSLRLTRSDRASGRGH